VITDEVPDDALATTRAPQTSVPDFAPGYRQRKAARKTARKVEASPEKSKQAMGRRTR
jgi:hypothetical protein